MLYVCTTRLCGAPDVDRMGGSLAGRSFIAEAMDESQLALNAYRETKYITSGRSTCIHWIGLAMLMIVLGVVLDDVGWEHVLVSELRWHADRPILFLWE